MTMYDVYLIQSDDGSLYVGQCSQFQARLYEHNHHGGFFSPTKATDGKRWHEVMRIQVGSRQKALEVEATLHMIQKQLEISSESEIITIIQLLYIKTKNPKGS